MRAFMMTFAMFALLGCTQEWVEGMSGAPVGAEGPVPIGVVPGCGDGRVDDGEDCDYGAENDDRGECTTQCQWRCHWPICVNDRRQVNACRDAAQCEYETDEWQLDQRIEECRAEYGDRLTPEGITCDQIEERDRRANLDLRNREWAGYCANNC